MNGVLNGSPVYYGTCYTYQLSILNLKRQTLDIYNSSYGLSDIGEQMSLKNLFSHVDKLQFHGGSYIYNRKYTIALDFLQLIRQGNFSETFHNKFLDLAVEQWFDSEGSMDYTHFFRDERVTALFTEYIGTDNVCGINDDVQEIINITIHGGANEQMIQEEFCKNDGNFKEISIFFSEVPFQYLYRKFFHFCNPL